MQQKIKLILAVMLLISSAANMNGQGESKMVVKGKMVNTGVLSSAIPIETVGVDTEIKNTENGDMIVVSLTVGEYTLLNNEGTISVGCVTTATPAQPDAMTVPSGSYNYGETITLSVPKVPGLIYRWEFPQGSFRGSSTTNSITLTVIAGQPGGLTVNADYFRVRAENPCATTDIQSSYRNGSGSLTLVATEPAKGNMLWANGGTVSDLEAAQTVCHDIGSEWRVATGTDLYSLFDNILLSGFSSGSVSAASESGSGGNNGEWHNGGMNSWYDGWSSFSPFFCVKDL
jgi:hypothetical protein